MIQVKNIVEGCILVECADREILFGAPSDVVKILIKKNFPVPYYVVLPHTFFKYGLCQASVEFLLYFHLFVRKKQYSEKFTIIGDEEHCNRQYDILQQTLIGPTLEQMKKWGIEESIIERSLKMNRFFQKDISTIKDVVNAIHFKECVAQLHDIEIRKVGENIFEISHSGEKALVDITVKSRPKPYITFPPINQPIKPMKLGFVNVGSYSGFDPTGDTCSLIIFSNYIGIAIDGSPWLRERLQSLGISMNHIQLFFITHMHDDHANILDMILNESKISIMTTRLIYMSFLVKASAILELPQKEIENLINFVEIVPGVAKRWFGTEFLAHETVHPIPTIGIKIENRIIVSGDTIWGSRLDEAHRVRAIDDDTFNKIKSLPLNDEAELIFMDAGGGDVHTDLLELAQIPEEQKMKIILNHTSSVDSNLEDLHLQTSWFGQYRTLEEESPISPIDALSLFYSPLLKEVHPNWVKVFMSQGKIKQYGPNQLILAEGTMGNAFYIILNGTVRVIKGNQTITTVQAGEFFGEISSMVEPDFKHQSSIISISPVEILEIESRLFYEFLNEEGLKERFQKLGELRPILLQTTMFKVIPERILQKIIDTTLIREISPHVSIVKQGDPADAFYLILEGSCEVIMEIDGIPRQIGTLNKYDVFGEIGLLEDIRRTASIESVTPVKVLILKKQDFEEIVKQVPGITYQLLMQAKKRRTQDEQRTTERRGFRNSH